MCRLVFWWEFLHSFVTCLAHDFVVVWVCSFGGFKTHAHGPQYIPTILFFKERLVRIIQSWSNKLLSYGGLNKPVWHKKQVPRWLLLKGWSFFTDLLPGINWFCGELQITAVVFCPMGLWNPMTTFSMAVCFQNMCKGKMWFLGVIQGT